MPDAESRCLPTTIRNRQRWKCFRPTYWIVRQVGLRNYPSITSPTSLPTLSISISTLSRFQPFRRVERDGDARRGTCGDHVTRHQRDEGRDMAEMRPDQIFGVPVLTQLAVHQVRSPMFVGSPASSEVVIQGPSMPEYSQFLPGATWGPRFCQSHTLPSLQTV